MKKGLVLFNRSEKRENRYSSILVALKIVYRIALTLEISSIIKSLKTKKLVKIGPTMLIFLQKAA